MLTLPLANSFTSDEEDAPLLQFFVAGRADLTLASLRVEDDHDGEGS